MHCDFINIIVLIAVVTGGEASLRNDFIQVFNGILPVDWDNPTTNNVTSTSNITHKSINTHGNYSSESAISNGSTPTGTENLATYLIHSKTNKIATVSDQKKIKNEEDSTFVANIVRRTINTPRNGYSDIIAFNESAPADNHSSKAALVTHEHSIMIDNDQIKATFISNTHHKTTDHPKNGHSESMVYSKSHLNKTHTTVLNITEDASTFTSNIADSTPNTLRSGYSGMIAFNKSTPVINQHLSTHFNQTWIDKTFLASNTNRKMISSVAKNGISRIIVYIPQDDSNELLLNKQEFNFVKKIRNLLLSFLFFSTPDRLGLKGDENLIAKEDNRSFWKVGSRIEKRDISDFFKQAKDALVETSKRILNTTAEAVESGVRKISIRSVPHHRGNRTSTKRHPKVIPRKSQRKAHICRKNCKKNPHVHRNKAKRTSKTPKVTATPRRQNKGKRRRSKGKPRIHSSLKPKAKSINKHSTHVDMHTNSIDRNTKYFLGERYTDITQSTVTSKKRTKTRRKHERRRQGRIKHEKTRANATKKLKRHISRKKCKQNDISCTNNSRSKKEIGNANQDKVDNTTPTLITKTNTLSKDLNVNCTANTQKNDKKEFFMYKDWLWQHLQSVKNGSLKSNSTKNFLRTHHFLFYSGGTDQSVTDASEPFFNFNQTIYRPLNTKATKVNLNSTLQDHHNRIKRSVKHKPFRKKSKAGAIDENSIGVEVTLEDEDYDYTDEPTVTEYESTERSTTDTNAKIAKAATISSTREIIRSTETTEEVTTFADTTTEVTTAVSITVTADTTITTTDTTDVATTTDNTSSSPDTSHTTASHATASPSTASHVSASPTTVSHVTASPTTSSHVTASPTTASHVTASHITTSHTTALCTTVTDTIAAETITTDAATTADTSDTVTTNVITTFPPITTMASYTEETAMQTLWDQNETILYTSLENPTTHPTEMNLFHAELQEEQRVQSSEPNDTATTLMAILSKNKRLQDYERQWNDGGGIRTRPLLVIVTVPSFIGIGVFIVALCFLTRSGGWCCQLFEPHRTPQVSVKESQEPSASRRPPRY